MASHWIRSDSDSSVADCLDVLLNLRVLTKEMSSVPKQVYAGH